MIKDGRGRGYLAAVNSDQQLITSIKLVSTFTEPIVLKSEDNDKLRITINDDLSGLLIFKGAISGKERRLQEESHIR